MVWVGFLLFSFLPQNGTARVPDVDILALTPEMIRFLEEHVAPVSPGRHLEALVDAIFSEDFLNLTYDNSRTKTAAETFESRNGNCLSFTTMLVAMARYLGMDAQFQEVVNLPVWNKRGDVLLMSRHMNAIVILAGRKMEVDFNPTVNKRWANKTTVSDRRAISQYYNNMGAEYFTMGEGEKAIAYFEKAIEIVPNLSFAWSNLGVAYKWAGFPDKAEWAYFKALEHNKWEHTAMVNLARLYADLGRGRESRKFLRKVHSFRKRNPFYHFQLGEEAYTRKEYKAAIGHFKRAIRRKGTQHEFYFALARAYAKLGRFQKAASHLEKARKYAPDQFNERRYSQKLNLLAVRN